MKKYCIFVASSPNSNIRFIIGVGIFVSIHLALATSIKAITSNGHLHLISQLFEFGDSEGGSLSYIKSNNFSFMPNSMKDYSSANNSNANVTSTHETGNTVSTPIEIVSNTHGIVCFEDFLHAASKKFCIEKDAKNRAYSFILSKGLLAEYSDFCRLGSLSDNPHIDCLKQLESLVTDKNQ